MLLSMLSMITKIKLVKYGIEKGLNWLYRVTPCSKRI